MIEKPSPVHPASGTDRRPVNAAIGVLLYHYGASFLERSGIPHPIAQLLHNGYLGVSLFFVLSGLYLHIRIKRI